MKTVLKAAFSRPAVTLHLSTTLPRPLETQLPEHVGGTAQGQNQILSHLSARLLRQLSAHPRRATNNTSTWEMAKEGRKQNEIQKTLLLGSLRTGIHGRKQDDRKSRLGALHSGAQPSTG